MPINAEVYRQIEKRIIHNRRKEDAKPATLDNTSHKTSDGINKVAIGFVAGSLTTVATALIFMLATSNT